MSREKGLQDNVIHLDDLPEVAEENEALLPEGMRLADEEYGEIMAIISTLPDRQRRRRRRRGDS